MFNFPFYRYPYNYQYYRNYNRYNNIMANKKNTQITEKAEELIEDNKDSITNSKEISNTINSRFNNNSEQPIFEIFGIKLYLDDIIILCLLFFLYQQNVNDEMLYIILLLLLFS